MDRPAFFAFYPTHFTSDLLVEAMDTLQVGAYLLLLCKAWQADPPASLPADDQILARLARVDAEVWAGIKAGVLAPFRLGSDGRYHSKRLRQEYDVALRLIRSRKRGGELTSQKRWGKGDASNAGSSAIAQQPAQLQPSFSTATEIEIETNTKTKESPTESGGKAPPTPKRPRSTPDSTHHQSIAAFTEAWRAKYGKTYPFNRGKDGAAVRDILKHLDGDAAAFREVVGRYLADDSEFAAKCGHTIGLLLSQLPTWLIDKPPPGRPKSTARADRTTEYAADTLLDAFQGDRPHEQPRDNGPRRVGSHAGSPARLDQVPAADAPG